MQACCYIPRAFYICVFLYSKGFLRNGSGYLYRRLSAPPGWGLFLEGNQERLIINNDGSEPVALAREMVSHAVLCIFIGDKDNFLVKTFRISFLLMPVNVSFGYLRTLHLFCACIDTDGTGDGWQPWACHLARIVLPPGYRERHGLQTSYF